MKKQKWKQQPSNALGWWDWAMMTPSSELRKIKIVVIPMRCVGCSAIRSLSALALAILWGRQLLVVHLVIPWHDLPANNAFDPVACLGLVVMERLLLLRWLRCLGRIAGFLLDHRGKCENAIRLIR